MIRRTILVAATLSFLGAMFTSLAAHTGDEGSSFLSLAATAAEAH